MGASIPGECSQLNELSINGKSLLFDSRAWLFESTQLSNGPSPSPSPSPRLLHLLTPPLAFAWVDLTKSSQLEVKRPLGGCGPYGGLPPPLLPEGSAARP